MKIHNTLPLLLSCLSRWEELPGRARFESEYAHPMVPAAGDFFEDYHDVLLALDWKTYRKEALKLDPTQEERRVRDALAAVQELFGIKLRGDIVIQGSFGGRDGYARFDRGTHRVFLGVDESFARGSYLDVLIVHELTHVARESRPEVWRGFGLDPRMTNDEFTRDQPVIEHLMGEGFSCAVSELLVPGEPAWVYVYQTEESLSAILRQSRKVDHEVKRELKSDHGHYFNLYGIEPIFSHYVWAWQWVKRLLSERAGGDPRRLVAACSKQFVESALEFELGKCGLAGE